MKDKNDIDPIDPDCDPTMLKSVSADVEEIRGVAEAPHDMGILVAEYLRCQDVFHCNLDPIGRDGYREIVSEGIWNQNEK